MKRCPFSKKVERKDWHLRLSLWLLCMLWLMDAYVHAYIHTYAHSLCTHTRANWGRMRVVHAHRKLWSLEGHSLASARATYLTEGLSLGRSGSSHSQDHAPIPLPSFIYSWFLTASSLLGSNFVINSNSTISFSYWIQKQFFQLIAT